MGGYLRKFPRSNYVDSRDDGLQVIATVKSQNLVTSVPAGVYDPGAESESGAARRIPKTSSAAELGLFGFKEEVEGGQRTVAAGDVLLHFDFFGVAEFFVGVDFLFEDAELVSNHYDFVEEGFEGDFLGLKGGVGGMEDEFAIVPADAEFGDGGVGFFEAQGIDGAADDFVDEGDERAFEAGDGDLGFGRFEGGGFGIDDAFAVIEDDIDGVFGDAANDAKAVLGMFDLHPDVNRLDFHEGESRRVAILKRRHVAAVQNYSGWR
jgi:hypothetical protein